MYFLLNFSVNPKLPYKMKFINNPLNAENKMMVARRDGGVCVGRGEGIGKMGFLKKRTNHKKNLMKK